MAWTASLHGSSGAFAPDTTFCPDLTPDDEVHFNAWHATFSGELIDDSHFDQTDNWMMNVRGMHDCKGTAEGRLIVAQELPGLEATYGAGAENLTGASAGNFTLTLASGKAYTFKGIIGSWKTRVVKVGLVTVTIGFESHGKSQ